MENIPTIVIVSIGIFSLLFSIGKISISKQKKLKDHMIWRKLLPIIPPILGVLIFLFLPLGLEEPTGMKVLFGLVAGLAAPHGRRIFKRLFLDKLGKSDESE